MYTSNAERIYYEHNPTVKQQRENYEERQYRLAQMHNKIFRGIDQINDAKSFMKVKTMLDAYAHEEGEQSTSVYNLNKRLKNKLSQLLIENDRDIKTKQDKIEELKNVTITESLETLQKLELESNAQLYNYMLQLNTGKDDTQNKRRIGSWCKEPNRVQAIALQKLSQLSQYNQLFKDTYKETILERAQNPQQVRYNARIKPEIEKLNSEVGALYIKGFNLRQVQQKYTAELKQMKGGTVFE